MSLLDLVVHPETGDELAEIVEQEAAWPTAFDLALMARCEAMYLAWWDSLSDEERSERRRDYDAIARGF